MNESISIVDRSSGKSGLKVFCAGVCRVCNVARLQTVFITSAPSVPFLSLLAGLIRSAVPALACRAVVAEGQTVAVIGA